MAHNSLRISGSPISPSYSRFRAYVRSREVMVPLSATERLNRSAADTVRSLAATGWRDRGPTPAPA